MLCFCTGAANRSSSSLGSVDWQLKGVDKFVEVDELVHTIVSYGIEMVIRSTLIQNSIL